MMVLTGPETGGPTCTRPCIPAPATINEPKPSPDTTTRQLNPFAACCPSPTQVPQAHAQLASCVCSHTGPRPSNHRACPCGLSIWQHFLKIPRPKRKCPPDHTLRCNKSLTFPIEKRYMSNKRLGIEMTDQPDQNMQRYLVKVGNMWRSCGPP